MKEDKIRQELERKLKAIGWSLKWCGCDNYRIINKNGQSIKQAKNRAKYASKKLIELAEEHEKVILIGHGLMNRLIAKQLNYKNWKGPVSPGKRYWEFGIYTNN